jgi:single-strand selective monofunctional uracil DNA glycosylase
MTANALTTIYRDLSRAVDGLEFSPPTTHVYNPLDYARSAVEKYLELAGAEGKTAIFLGMNPGPWGMAQTGVPFGSVSLVQDWLGIDEPVGKPANEHPRRPVQGFAVQREEVSGSRFWGWARDRFGSADRFFSRFFVANYCPLVFMEASGRNRTPDKLPVNERNELFRPCDHALRQLVQALKPEWVIGVGKFAEDRAVVSLEGLGVRTGRILHPSPASPAANRGWAQQAERQLIDMGFSAALESTLEHEVL